MAGEKKYSYIRNPFSRNGWFSFVISIISLILTAAVMISSVYYRGEIFLFTAAMGVTAILMDLMALMFTYLAFGEKNRNYAFALAGGAVAAVVLLVWIYILVR